MAASQASPILFHGELSNAVTFQTPAEVRIDGAVHRALLTPDRLLDASPQILAADRAQVFVWEARDGGSPPLPPKPGSIFYALNGRMQPAAQFESNGTRLQILEYSHDDQWFAWAARNVPDSPSTRVAGAGCIFAAYAKDAAPKTPEWAASGTSRVPDASPTGVKATCQLDGTFESQASRFFVLGSTVRLHDADGRDIIIETGRGVSSSRPSATSPAGEPVTRVLEVRNIPGESSLGVSADGRLSVNLTAPAFAAAGRLGVSASSLGLIEWGDMRAEGELPAMEPSGAFVLSTTPQGQLLIRGPTSNGPRIAAAPVDDPSGVHEGWVAAAAVAGLLATLLWGRRLWWGALGLFTRLSRSDAANHGVRLRIMELAESQPGLSITQLSQALDVSFNSTSHHLRQLQRQGLVTLRRFGRKTAVFVTEQVSFTEQRSLHVLRAPLTARLLRLLEEQPGLTQRELAAQMGITQPYVCRLMRQLVSVGSVQKIGRGRLCQFKVATSPPATAASLAAPAPRASVRA